MDGFISVVLVGYERKPWIQQTKPHSINTYNKVDKKPNLKGKWTKIS